MPLLHQDNNRGGGGSRENRRSLAEYLGLDTSQLAEAATPTTSKEGENEWRWENPSSPEAAQTAPFHNYGDGTSGWGDEERKQKNFTSLEPLQCVGAPSLAGAGHIREPRSPAAAQSPCALVPSACFPPRHPVAFASYSENARPGGWEKDQTEHGMEDLITSLKALAMPPPVNRSKSFHLKRLSCDALETMESPWLPEGAHAQPQEPRSIARRASFCGVVSNPRNERSVRWQGTLPGRALSVDAGFSPKLFLGGLPYDITEQSLMHALRHFQPMRVEWPGRGSGGARGCAYVTLESERRVRALLAACRRDGHDWYYRLVSRNPRTKEVQVIPWAVSESNWVVSGSGAGSVRLEPSRTVFVGALHGMLSAAALATIMNDLFSGVIYAGIDTDKNKYPIGSGRVTFNNVRSYIRAISAAFIEICTDKFTKKVQVDPYLEDSMCSMCNLQQGPYFCREPVCFRYFCRSCWSNAHVAEQHKPLMRNCKSAILPSTTFVQGPSGSRSLGLHSSGSHSSGQNSSGPNTSGPHSRGNDGGGFNGFGNASNEAVSSPTTSGSGAGSAEEALTEWSSR